MKYVATRLWFNLDAVAAVIFVVVVTFSVFMASM